MNYFIGALKKYTVFSGRATRSEFWYFVLFYFILSYIFSFFDTLFNLTGGVVGSNPGILHNLFFFFFLLPSIAIIIRRLHDSGKSGWWFFAPLIALIILLSMIVFGYLNILDLSDFISDIWFLYYVSVSISVIGFFIVFVFCLFKSTPGDNKYGPNIKGMTNSIKSDSFLPKDPQTPSSI